MLFLGRKRILIFISEHSRLAALMPARDLADLPRTFPLAVSDVLRAIGVPAVDVNQELQAMSEVRFAPTNSRSLLGTINDFKVQLRWRLTTDGEPSLLDLALKLSETLVGPLESEYPSEATRRLFGRIQ